ncbi:hypothetical protein CHU92_04315 [Flavobacterium cyanobacteriorum]|uniref:Redoxin domain-containing protein n=1 Tax=Flavobacterium cyanobacteriorum TaxID=2022802 RepID=A0A255ZJD0_9FLAO|nr:hypothetical protein [Flavobacterium cyanobacteriorum]OYQ41586.1 hypothetical protein CHU92_04315 [Flavobacterium cyanobacteriorum]
MKKIIYILIALVAAVFVIQIVRFNYQGRKARNFEYVNIENKKLKLKNVFDKKTEKYLLYILPECESCITKIEELVKTKANEAQIIVISAGLSNFDYEQYYLNKLENKDVTFLIDVKNNFYRDFGLGFVEEFPTVIMYNKEKNTFKRI